ncbi:response regulator [Burkholderia mallei]|nr:response regulator [Burkholderia mallei]
MPRDVLEARARVRSPERARPAPPAQKGRCDTARGRGFRTDFPNRRVPTLWDNPTSPVEPNIASRKR